jgi:hypothetical protein
VVQFGGGAGLLFIVAAAIVLVAISIAVHPWSALAMLAMTA